MNQTIVTTNLRVPADDWYEFKNFASELNMSVNVLINKLIQKTNTQSAFADDLIKPSAGHDPIWDLPKLAKMPNKPMGASKEDKIIYGV